ncbi:minor tail protein [Rhodococcus phage Mbo2]|uniref:Minor tail protein n=1 Tax=Rhodococcus phage Mbo2 TaxID=2936911 RepID=A0A9E7LH51_9CAUD|nr:minor tail protein [Rhodococcus phage Mbo2]
MGTAPSRVIQEAFVAPTSEIVRRIEIYEYDGITPFLPALWSDILVGGTVNADQTRDERRSMDLELDNSTGALSPKVGGLWYDKVFKVFYGLRTEFVERDPKVIIVEEYESVGQALALKTLMARAGIKVVHYNPLVTTYADVEEFDVLVSISSTYSRKLALLTEAFGQGKSILTFGLDATTSQLPYIIGTSAASLSADSGLRSFEQTGLADPVVTGWDDYTITGPQSYRKILTVAPGAVTVANTYDVTNGFSPGIVMRADMSGSVWIHVLQNKFTSDEFETADDEELCSSFLGSAIDRLDYFQPQEIWECQIGEFVPDDLSDADEKNDRIKVTARDYTARCLNSKLTKATAFTATQSIESIISALAVNSGIRNMNLPVTSKVLGKDQTWERDTERWAIMKEIALANNYEIWFDATGYLRLTPQQDPVATPPSLILETGIGGNLVSRQQKTGSSNLFNHITVIGESSDTTIPLCFGEAINNAPNSPSRIGGDGLPGGIGERTKNITSPLVTTDDQAKELATAMLAVASLEEFELNFSAVLFPWLEPGEIVEMAESNDEYWGPARYLLSTISLPLDLSPMSGTAKRVIKVG